MRPLETDLASPPGGPYQPPRVVQSGSTTGQQGMEEMLLGGQLVLVSACLTGNPLITDGQNTHTPVLEGRIQPMVILVDMMIVVALAA
jgi:hypothetical protein